MILEPAWLSEVFGEVPAPMRLQNNATPISPPNNEEEALSHAKSLLADATEMTKQYEVLHAILTSWRERQSQQMLKKQGASTAKDRKEMEKNNKQAPIEAENTKGKEHSEEEDKKAVKSGSSSKVQTRIKSTKI